MQDRYAASDFLGAGKMGDICGVLCDNFLYDFPYALAFMFIYCSYKSIIAKLITLEITHYTEI
jgi:hypothetical protein